MTSFVFTGKAVVEGIHFQRKYLIALAKEQGHAVHKKVTEATDYLISDHSVLDAVGHKTKKLAVYMKTSHTLRITTAQFLGKMGFL